MKELQESVRKFCDQRKLNCRPTERVLDVISELGEVAKEILKSGDYGKKPPEKSDAIREELGDLLFSLMALANELDIDLEASLDDALKKYESRMELSGHPRSNG